MRAGEPAGCETPVGLCRYARRGKQRIIRAVERYLVEIGHPVAQRGFGLGEVLGEKRVDPRPELGGDLARVLGDGFLIQVYMFDPERGQRLDAIRQIGVTEQTYYRWKKRYGGMGTDQLKELKRLQKENERLRKAVSDLTLDKLILAEAAKGNF